MQLTKQKIVSLIILFLARLVDRKPQAGCHIVYLKESVMFITPDGFSIALNKPAVMELAGKLSPIGLLTQTLREAQP